MTTNLVYKHRSAIANAVKDNRPEVERVARAQLAAAKLERSVVHALPLLTPQDRARIRRLLSTREPDAGTG
jgi:hypothetical protein